MYCQTRGKVYGLDLLICWHACSIYSMYVTTVMWSTGGGRKSLKVLEVEVKVSFSVFCPHFY